MSKTLKILSRPKENADGRLPSTAHSDELQLVCQREEI